MLKTKKGSEEFQVLECMFMCHFVLPHVTFSILPRETKQKGI